MQVDFSNPMPIAIPTLEGDQTVNAYHAPRMESKVISSGDFVGDVSQGGSVNFRSVNMTPHGNGTHTECIGHITPERQFITDCLRRFWFQARVISVMPTKQENGDRVVTADQLAGKINGTEALVLRTMPNDELKLTTNYSGANPPYLDVELVQAVVEAGIEHLLIDLPSVDAEEDGGALAGHKMFWQYPDNPRMEATITELIYVPDAIPDGDYALNLMVAPIAQDAAPSWPVLYRLST